MTAAKAIAAFGIAAVGEAISAGLLSGKWALVGQVLTIAAITAGVYTVPNKQDSEIKPSVRVNYRKTD